jgi:hypothetical protein
LLLTGSSGSSSTIRLMNVLMVAGERGHNGGRVNAYAALA